MLQFSYTYFLWHFQIYGFLNLGVSFCLVHFYFRTMIHPDSLAICKRDMYICFGLILRRVRDCTFYSMFLFQINKLVRASARIKFYLPAWARALHF